MPAGSHPAFAVLRLATQVVDGVQDRVVAAGFDDVRPVHGFAFVRIAAGGATAADLAVHLGITKQAASQMVDGLVQRGYVRRRQHPDDGRAWALELTNRGHACTRAADRAAVAVLAEWERTLGRRRYGELVTALDGVVTAGPVRPYGTVGG